MVWLHRLLVVLVTCLLGARVGAPAVPSLPPRPTSVLQRTPVEHAPPSTTDADGTPVGRCHASPEAARYRSRHGGSGPSRPRPTPQTAGAESPPQRPSGDGVVYQHGTGWSAGGCHEDQTREHQRTRHALQDGVGASNVEWPQAANSGRFVTAFSSTPLAWPRRASGPSTVNQEVVGEASLVPARRAERAMWAYCKRRPTPRGATRASDNP